jgi:hypothetical protein
MKTSEWEECLCECYKWWLLFWKRIWKHLSERNVYVNVTYDDCCSERSEYENIWVRVMFMWMLHMMTVVMKVNMKTFEWE